MGVKYRDRNRKTRMCEVQVMDLLGLKQEGALNNEQGFVEGFDMGKFSNSSLTWKKVVFLK